METTITKKIKGSTMETIFDSTELINIRHFKIKNKIFKEEDFNENSTYLYEIKIRHNDNENPEELLLNTIKTIKK